MSTIIIRRRNKNEAINNNWIGEEKAIGKFFAKKIEDLFASYYPLFDDRMNNLRVNYVIDNENMEPSRITTETEIKEVVWLLHPLKSPGPDEFPRIF